MTTRNLLSAAKALIFGMALLAAPAALAEHGKGFAPPRPPIHSVPEFDPAAGGALVALLAGGALLVANRRQRK